MGNLRYPTPFFKPGNRGCEKQCILEFMDISALGAVAAQYGAKLEVTVRRVYLVVPCGPDAEGYPLGDLLAKIHKHNLYEGMLAEPRISPEAAFMVLSFPHKAGSRLPELLDSYA